MTPRQRDLEGNRWYFGTYQPGAYWEKEEDRGAAGK
jgi:hypothetical protein